MFGQIGHTQPRRIAARSVANRISQELGTLLGDAVGFVNVFNFDLSDGQCHLDVDALEAACSGNEAACNEILAQGR